MDLTWWAVAIAGCVGLALCIAAVLLAPMAAERRRLRPLANVGRLTTLPEYVRAARLRSATMVIAMVLLVVGFAGAVLAAARPTGLPSAAGQSAAGQPEDVMLCVGPGADPAAAAVLRDVAGRVTAFDTQRIGLTSSNRRVIPLTRDYQYAAARLRGDVAGFTAPVSYVDYAENAVDVLALCLNGFPDFEQPGEQRRSVIYVGPDAVAAAPTLFSAEKVTDLAKAAGAQVNVLVTGPDTGTLAALARATGGRSFPADDAVSGHLAEIRDNPPQARSTADAAPVKPAESPDLPLGVALLAALALAALPVVIRR